MVTPAWRYRIQRRSWLAAVPAAGATNSGPRPGRRPKTTSTDYGIKYGAAERRRGGGPRTPAGGAPLGWFPLSPALGI